MKYQTFFGYLTISFILISTPVKLGLAQTNNQFLLAQNSDNFFQECFRNSANKNQADMNYCAYLEHQQADKTLNQLYQQLRSQLSSTNKELLTDAQLAWISLRDKEWEFNVSRMGRISPGGSMYPGIKSNFYADFTKKRNVELEAYVRDQTLQPNSGNYQAVDRRLNEVYQQLRSSLKEPQKLQSAQLAWIKFRDTSCDFESSYFSNSACLTRLTEKRVQELLRYLPRTR